MNQNNIISFIPDEEIILHQRTEAEKGNDLLNTSTYVDALVQCIESAPIDKTFTIGLFGEWGSGKSSIVKTALNRMQTKSASENKNVKFITYDSWKYASDSFRRMFILELQTQLQVKPLKQFEQFYDNINEDVKVRHETNNVYWYIILAFFVLLSILTICIDRIPEKVGFGLGTITALFTIWLNLKKYSTDDLKLTVQKSRLFAPEQFEECYKEIINESRKEPSLLQKALRWISPAQDKADKIIIVIDNIDRCQPDVTYTLLSDIKSFLGNSQDVIFIVPVDVNALRKHIINRSRDDNASHDADEFLRKFFNVSVWIKSFQNEEMYDFTQNLNFKYSLGLTPTSISVISREFATNPRRIIQLLNNLSIELRHYETTFRQSNESIICLINILREEYPDSYKEIVDNPKKLFELTKDDKCKCKSLLRRTEAVYQIYSSKLDVLDRILSNSVVSSDLPLNVKSALLTGDITIVKDYLASERANSEALIYNVKTFLWEKIRKAVDRKTFVTDLYGYILSIIEMQKSNLLVDSDYTQLFNLVNTDEAWDTVVSKLYLSKSQDLADFSVFLHGKGYAALVNAVIRNITNYKVDSMKLSEQQIIHLYNVCRTFHGKMITEELVNTFDKVFATDPDSAFLLSYQEPSRFFTSELISKVIAQIKRDDLGFEQNAFTQFRDICKLCPQKDDKNLVEYINKMVSVMPEYESGKSNNATIIEVYRTINDVLEICHDLRIKDPKCLQNLLSKGLKTVTVNNYGRSTNTCSLYTDCVSNAESLSELNRFFFNVQQHYPNMLLFTTDFATFMLKNASIGKDFCSNLSKLIDFECPLEQYSVSIKEYTTFDESMKQILHYLFNDPSSGKPRVSEDWVRERIVCLVQTLLTSDNNDIAEFLNSESVNSSVVSGLLETHISNSSLTNMEQLLKTPLSSMTVKAFSENIDSYHNNINVLSLIAANGSRATLSKLNKIIASKFTSDNIKDGKELIQKLHYCNTRDYNMLVSTIEAIEDNKLSPEDKKELNQKLKSVNS